VAAKGIGSPITSTASDAWDVIKGEAAGAASLALAKAALELETYADKSVAKGATGLKTSAGSSDFVKKLMADLGIGGVPPVIVIGAVVLIAVLVLRK
jgi:hypothetical protein